MARARTGTAAAGDYLLGSVKTKMPCPPAGRCFSGVNCPEMPLHSDGSVPTGIARYCRPSTA